MSRKAMEFIEAYEMYLSQNARTWRPVTASNYRRLFEYRFAHWWRGRLVHTIRPKEVDQQLHSEAARARTVLCWKSMLSSFFNWCVMQEFCDAAPTAYVRVRGTQERRRGIALTPNQAAELLRAARPERTCFLLVAFGLYTGLRARNLALLTPQHIWNGEINFAGSEMKTGTALCVPLHPDLRPLVRELPLRCSMQWRRALIKRARTLAGLPPVRIHDLRHTFASWLARVAPMPVVAALLGHRAGDGSITALYCHPRPEELRAALLRLPRLLTPSNTT